MGPLYYVIAILGCGDGSVQCSPAATVPTQYSTQAACEAATGEALMANSDLDFPTIVAECRASRARPAAATKHKKREKPMVIALRG
jgi:hypothetical protein